MADATGEGACPGCDGCHSGHGLDPAATLAARTGRGLAWRTLTGREYITYPKSWTEALRDYDHPEHTPPTRRPPETRQERRQRRLRELRERPEWNTPPPF